MKVGIMQPYLFPYLGYFQLINAVDKFVIYDDVQYIKGGWVNRNRILINNKDSIIISKIKKDDFKLNINERFLVENNEYENNKLLKSIQLAYKKAPYYNTAEDLVKDIILFQENNLAKYIINSIEKICQYLDVKTKLVVSSEIDEVSSEIDEVSSEIDEVSSEIDEVSSEIDKGILLNYEDKVIKINKILGANTYINAIGGSELYSKSKFKENEIELFFLKMDLVEYKQFNNEFIPNLSIIDVLMFNSKEEIKHLLNLYELI